ncbi:MAG: PAS domain S-box protein [bacterium]
MTDTVLSRFSQDCLREVSHLSQTQQAVDEMVGRFAEQASDWRSLAAMTAGSLFYRLGRVGTLSLTSRPLHLLSYGVGLTAEVIAFEGTHRLLTSLTESSIPANLWRWNGRGGWREGLASSFVTFGMLKGAGALAEGQNLFLRHLFSDLSMVGGHQIAGSLGFAPTPEGSFAEQMLHAEATNWQLGAGASLLHQSMPGIALLERSLELSLRAHERGSFGSTGEGPSSSLLAWQTSSEGGRNRPASERIDPIEESRRPVLMAVQNGEGATAPVPFRNSTGEMIEGGLRKFLNLNPAAAGAVEILPDGAFTPLLTVNRAMEKLLGYSEREMMSRSLLEFIHPEDFHQLNEAIRRLQTSDNFNVGELRLIKKSGETVWCQARGGADMFGTSRVGVAFFEDVSDRRAEQARTHALLKAMPDMMFRLSADGRFLDSHAGTGTGEFVIPPVETVGTNVNDLPIPEPIKRLGFESFRKALETGELHRVEYTLPMLDGSARHHEARVVGIGNQEVVVILRDITELKRAESSLRESEARNNALLRAIPDTMMRLKSDGTFLDFRSENERNPLALSNFTSGKNIRDTDLPAEVCELFLQNLERVRETKSTQRFEYNLNTPEGPRDYEAHVSLSAENEAVVIVRDITERKRSQQLEIARERFSALQLVGRGLAHDANNACSSLLPYVEFTINSLKNLIELAERAAEGLQTSTQGTFLDAFDAELRRAYEFITHKRSEIISPMQPSDRAHLAIDILQRVLEDVDTIETQAERIRDMIAEFRELTDDPKENHPFDLHLLLRERQIRPHLGSNIDLSIRRGAASGQVIGHKPSIERVLQNLVGNARDAMEGRENPRITIETQSISLSAEDLFRLNDSAPGVQPGRFLRIRIEDNGKGMESKILSQIFEPYFSTKEKNHSGSGHGGIGLAINRKMVGDMGGFMRAESTAGAGTVFEVFLRELPPISETMIPQERDRILKTPILILDDEVILAEVTPRNLRRHGFETFFSATDAEDAFRILKEHPEIGLLIFDFNLPGLTGLELIGRLRKQYPTLPKVLWTGGDPQRYEHLLEEYGVAVSKPISMDSLAKTIESLLLRLPPPH